MWRRKIQVRPHAWSMFKHACERSPGLDEGAWSPTRQASCSDMHKARRSRWQIWRGTIQVRPHVYPMFKGPSCGEGTMASPVQALCPCMQQARWDSRQMLQRC